MRCAISIVPPSIFPPRPSIPFPSPLPTPLPRRLDAAPPPRRRLDPAPPPRHPWWEPLHCRIRRLLQPTVTGASATIVAVLLLLSHQRAIVCLLGEALNHSLLLPVRNRRRIRRSVRGRSHRPPWPRARRGRAFSPCLWPPQFAPSRVCTCPRPRPARCLATAAAARACSRHCRV